MLNISGAKMENDGKDRLVYYIDYFFTHVVNTDPSSLFLSYTVFDAR